MSRITPKIVHDANKPHTPKIMIPIQYSGITPFEINQLWNQEVWDRWFRVPACVGFLNPQGDYVDSRWSGNASNIAYDQVMNTQGVRIKEGVSKEDFMHWQVLIRPCATPAEAEALRKQIS